MVRTAAADDRFLVGSGAVPGGGSGFRIFLCVVGVVHECLVCGVVDKRTYVLSLGSA